MALGQRTIIDTFNGEFYFLSNFYSTPIVFDGETYPSVENAYQAAKSDDPEHRSICRLVTASSAKRSGRKCTLRPNWESVKVDIMRSLLEQKFRSGSELSAKLQETGDAQLIEGNWWHDHFWGVCDGRGQNMLGRLLMEIREKLK